MIKTIKTSFLTMIFTLSVAFAFGQSSTSLPISGTYTVTNAENESFNKVQIVNDTLYFMHNNTISSQFLIKENIKGLTYRVEFFSTPTNTLGNDFFLHIDAHSEDGAIITLNYPDFSKQLLLSK